MRTVSTYRTTARPHHRSHNQGRPTLHRQYGADRIGLIGFHDRGFVIARPADPYAPWLKQRSQDLHNRMGGCTNMTDGLRQAINLLSAVPKGGHRRIWLLSDGRPNKETAGLMNRVDEARRAYININTIGFGDDYDRDLLMQISRSTHNGKFVSVRSLQQLTQALVQTAPPRGNRQPSPHRTETTILCIDLSASMAGSMGAATKVQVVEEAILHLLHYKQRLFA